MKKITLPLIILVTAFFAQLLFSQPASAASASFTCKPHFTGGHYGSRCPPQKNHPDQQTYPGHTYHTIRVKLVVKDPSRVDDRTYSDTFYCDCGRGTTKCTITAKYTASSGRNGHFVGPNSSSAAGGLTTDPHL